ncbi:MAG: 5'/3'-nucleotidase SurE, partial [Acidimicrobiales bacterium]|nr:5'/3'-nucleotidase SurE [Acidimicrobiales bacterium]
MKVLVTNDDGISSPGLAALAAMVVDAGMNPVVAAPAQDHSGAAAALGPLADPSRVVVDQVAIGSL